MFLKCCYPLGFLSFWCGINDTYTVPIVANCIPRQQHTSSTSKAIREKTHNILVQLIPALGLAFNPLNVAEYTTEQLSEFL